MLDDIIGFAVVVIPTILGIAGWLMPVTQSGKKHRWYLAVVGALLSVLIFWQQRRASATHEREVVELHNKIDSANKDLQLKIGEIRKDSERPINVTVPPVQIPPVTVQMPKSVTFRQAPAEDQAALIQTVDYDKHQFTTTGTWPGKNHKVPCDVVITLQDWDGKKQESRHFKVTIIKNLGAMAYVTVAESISDKEQYLQIQDAVIP